MIYIFRNWRNFINSIRDFQISVSDNSLINSINYRNTNIPDVQEITKDNTEKITLFNLPSQEKLTFSFDVSNQIPQKSYQFKGNDIINLFFNKSKKPSNISGSAVNNQGVTFSYDNLGGAFFDHYFNELFGAAVFNISASCDNCEAPSFGASFLVPYSPDSVGFSSSQEQQNNGITQKEFSVVGGGMIPNRYKINKYAISHILPSLLDRYLKS